MKPLLSILCSALALVGACSDPKFDEASQTGPNPLLPDPKQFLIPPINVAPGEGWPAGKTPVVAAGLQIKALVQGLHHPRFVYVLPDGGWSDTRAGVERVRWLAELGVPTIHLSIGIAPLSVECERVTVITDPAQALDHITADTVAALTARHRRPNGR